DGLAAWMRRYRNHGMVDRDHVELWGVNMRLQPLQAVVASHVLRTVDALVAARQRVAALLDAGLARLGDVARVPARPPSNREAFALYMACFDERDALLAHLIARGVEAKVHYPVPLHLQAAAAELGYRRGDFPRAERQADELVTLPAHQFVTDEQVAF